MTIYVVNWTENGGLTKEKYATSSYSDAKLKYKEVSREALVRNADIAERDQAIVKYQIKTQAEVIDLINKV